MATERTLSIIKPDAVEEHGVGGIVSMLEAGGLRVVAMRMLQWSRPQAEAFYAVHRERPFYGSLVELMTSGRIVAMVLEGEGAIAKNREIMGATDPAKAVDNTIRKRFGTNVEKNAVHGSDAPETAKGEIAFLFPGTDLL